MSRRGPSQNAVDDAAYDGAAAAARRSRPGAARSTTIFKAAPPRGGGYTTLVNAVVDDDRLGLDELGALTRLLKLPPDWQMHPSQIRNRVWRIGRDKYYRIMRTLADAGYVTEGEMIRNDRGEYIARSFMVHAEPQLVTRRADIDGDDDGDSGAGRTPEDMPEDMLEDLPEEAQEAMDDRGGVRDSDAADHMVVPDGGVTSLPHTGLPDTGNPYAGSPARDKEKIYITNNPPTPLSPKPLPETNERSWGSKTAVPLPNAEPSVSGHGTGPPMFDRGDVRAPSPPAVGGDPPSVDDFLAAWSRTGGPCVSVVRVQRAWVRLGDAERVAALARLPDFLADRAARKWKLCDAGTYLKDRMWAGFAAQPTRPEVYFVKPGEPEFVRWSEHLAKWRGPFSRRWFERAARRNGLVSVPSRWPPGGDQPPEPLEELRAAVMLIQSPDSDRVLIARDTAEFTAWLKAAQRLDMSFGVSRYPDLSKPVGAPNAEIVGTYFPARMPPPIPDEGG